MNNLSRQPNDVLFLQPVRYAGEKAPRGRVRMLYADASGRVCASVSSRSAYEMAADSVARTKRSRKAFAMVGLETIPGRFIPAAVEIGPDEAGEIQHIRDHAMRSASLPDVLKSHIRPIIRRCAGTREAVIPEKRPHRAAGAPRVTTRVLDRPLYYPEHDIEVSMPIYKAAYSYPLLLLKRLAPDEFTPPGTQRLLVLDSDEDLAIVKVPTRLVRCIEVELAVRRGINRQLTAVLISRSEAGPGLCLMPISRLQKRGLDAITRYFEATGHKKQPALAVYKVIDLARQRVVSSNQP